MKKKFCQRATPSRSNINWFFALIHLCRRPAHAQERFDAQARPSAGKSGLAREVHFINSSCAFGLNMVTITKFRVTA